MSISLSILIHDCDPQSEDGDIIDCIDIYKQPAFDHPLLKNHTIQMRPSNYNSEKISPLKPLEQLWHQSGSCREGTVPIRRTGKADLLRAGSLTYGMKAHSYQKESARMRLTGINHGAAAYIGVWNIYVAPDETNISSIFVARQGKLDLLNSGWISESGGCFDMMCPGFVQTNNQIALGAVLTPLSVYNGPQRFIHVKIHMDLKNDHWWLDINSITIGYWPSRLLYNMVYDADLLLWGGQVHNTVPGGRHTSTQMDHADLHAISVCPRSKEIPGSESSNKISLKVQLSYSKKDFIAKLVKSIAGWRAPEVIRICGSWVNLLGYD
ncbi:hypothetical protein MRB53_006702 [Persea americana]|uniref:Uncharacterized protein n=1 Tax=Persea americana TaxID=3435 RepID=A0ACC2MHY8_PERAE|nr:hypothetical protein MRB53_006702 [Persea americana]